MINQLVHMADVQLSIFMLQQLGDVWFGRIQNLVNHITLFLTVPAIVSEC